MNQRAELARRGIRGAAAVVIVLAGVGICAWLVRTKPQPRRLAQGARLSEVRATVVQAQTRAFPVVGHGTVRPKRQLSVIPQVSGKLTFVHPDLAQGRVINKGDVLFEVDPTVYESRLKQADAEARGLEALVERQRQEQDNLAVRIAHATQLAAIDEADHHTSKRLFDADGVGTQRDVDLLLQKSLRSKDALSELENALRTMPHTIAQSEAQLDAAKARLAQARHDSTNTRIVCPFKARVESVQASISQVVTAFFSIATLTDLEAFELVVGIDPRELRWLDENIHPNRLASGTATDGPVASVHWSLHEQDLRWPGYVSRCEKVDETTRTTRMVVEVRDADMIAQTSDGDTGIRPALSIGMFCRAELPGKPLHNAILVPRSALYEDNRVYVVEPDPAMGDLDGGRLAERRVAPLRSISDQVLVDFDGRDETEVCELRPGDRLVVSPLEKPVVGMPVRVRSQSMMTVTDATARASVNLDSSLACARGALGQIIPRSHLAMLHRFDWRPKAPSSVGDQ